MLYKLKKQDKKPEDQVKKDISKLGGFGGSGGESDTNGNLLALERCAQNEENRNT